MTDTSKLIDMAGDIGFLKSQIGSLDGKVADVQSDVTEMKKSLQDIKDTLGIRAGRMSMLKDIGLVGWAFISVCLMGFGEQLFSAATWVKSHLSH